MTGKRWDSVAIVPAGQKPGRSGVEYIFNLVTARRHASSLGPRSGHRLAGRSCRPCEKIAQLKRYAAQNNGSLDQPDGAQLEIRDDGALVSRPRPEVEAAAAGTE